MAGVGVGMQRWAGRVALVTGASAGIGRATAKALAKHGMKVVGCAETTKVIEDDVQSLSADSSVTGSLHAIKCDLTQEEEILAMFAEIKERFGGVDVCINNAGISHGGSLNATLGLLNGETNKWRDMLDVNVLAVAICCREAVRQMEEKGTKDGQLIMINSMAGHRIAPWREGHFYAATKHAVTALTEGIRQELREKKIHIRVGQISPGIVETEFRVRMFPNDPEKALELYKTIEPMKAEDLADSVLYILQAPPHVQVHDILIRPTEMKD